MATAVFHNQEDALATREPLDDRHAWGFALLLALVATLFVRPADLLPALADWPIYQYLIVCCLVVSARSILRQLAQRQLADQPVTACLLALLLAIGASHLAHAFVWGARMSMYEFGKMLALYLLIVGLVNTPRRLFLFVKWLTLAITIVASLALLDRYEIISIAALESIQDHDTSQDGRDILIERIRGTGIFQDPNDFGLILVFGLSLCGSFLFRPSAGWPRYLWLPPCLLLLTALALTHSRGALLAVLSILPAALAYFRGGKLGVLPLLALPLFSLVFSGRMTDINAVNEGTGQSRIQIWSESISVWREYPMFGIGQGLLVDELGLVTHNSFLHCYAELGVFGGTAFISCFLAAGLNLWAGRDDTVDSRSADRAIDEPRDIAHLRGFIFIALVAAAVGMLTISRQFVAPTYLILGLAAAAQSLPNGRMVRWRIGNRFAALCLLVSASSLVAFYLAVRILVRW